MLCRRELPQDRCHLVDGLHHVLRDRVVIEEVPADGTRDKSQAAKEGKELYDPFGQCLRTDGGTGCLDFFS